MASRTFLAILSIFSLSLGGCAILEPPKATKSVGPQARVFENSYDEVWRAVQKTLVKYPIQLNNIDQGIIETDLIKGDQIWRPPFTTGDKAPNTKYVIRVNVVKGRTKGNESTRVTILKSLSIEKDFFTGEARLPSDGLEEKALLYRVSRELKLERSMRKAFERRNI